MSERGAPAIAVRNVSKSFGGVAAVQDVSFTVSSGEVVALAGENGAGKSTVKNIIGGILRPDTGQVEFGAAVAASGAGGARIPVLPRCTRRPACSRT